MDIQNYRLATNEEVPDDVVATYLAESSRKFSEETRTFHLSRLPQLRSEKCNAVGCPICEEVFTFRSLQIDHLIPVKVYCRYEMFRHSDHTTRNSRLGGLLKEAHNDISNLMLICQTCNRGKSEEILSKTDYEHLAKVTNDDKYEENYKTLQSILRNAESDFFFRGKATRSSARIRTGGGAPARASGGFARSQRMNPMGPPPEEVHKNNIENQITSHLSRGRPAWDDGVHAHLVQSQTVKDQQINGRLCFCCFGIFRDPAFQIDHIRAVSNSAATLTKAQYNDPQNLIPVCRTCNGAKGASFAIQKQWYEDQIKRRIIQKLPGLALDSENYDDAVATRDRVFGLSG